MKKIISAMLAASLSISCIAAAHADRVTKIDDELNKDGIHIIYNDTVVEYEDVKPVNVDGRVMIPFRAALEAMGAEIDYDVEERKVTASKGDITITFTLMDDTIYIDKNGEQSTITMDVPMIVQDDRTLVPIRFMSNALGMQVGWDGYTQAVLIMDYDEYISDFIASMPNLSKLIEKSEDKFDKGNMTLNLNGAFGGEQLDASAVADMLVKDNKAGVNFTASINSSKVSFEDANANIVFDGTTIYVKSNIFEMTGLPVDPDMWLSLNIEDVLPAEAAEILTMSMQSDKANYEDVLKAMVTTEGDAVFDEVMELAAVLDLYELMNDKIVITETEDGYTVEIKIETEEMAELIHLPPEEKTKISYDVKVEYGSDKATGHIVMSFEAPDGSSMNFTFDGVFEESAEGETVTVPETSTDMAPFLGTLR